MDKFYNITKKILKITSSFVLFLGLVSCATQSVGGVETDGVYYNPSSDKTLAQAEAENNANDGMIRIGGAYFDANGNGAEDLFYDDSVTKADATEYKQKNQTVNIYTNPGYYGSQTFSLEPTTDWGRYDGVDVQVNYWGNSFWYSPFGWNYYGLGYYPWYRHWGWYSWYIPYYAWGWNPWYSPYYYWGGYGNWGYPYYGYYGYGSYYNGYYGYYPRYGQRAYAGSRPGIRATNRDYGRSIINHNSGTLRNSSSAVRSGAVNSTIRSSNSNVRETIRPDRNASSTIRNNATGTIRSSQQETMQTTRPIRASQNQTIRTTRPVRTEAEQMNTNSAPVRSTDRVVRPQVDRSQIRSTQQPTRSGSTIRTSPQYDRSSTPRSSSYPTNRGNMTPRSSSLERSPTYSQPSRSSMGSGSIGTSRSSIGGGARGTRR
ncbi:prolyl-tRNA synthetase [Weeksella virosa]|uniref:Prolyl-tRNA synthetase n=3 Tax=Weeksella virosa TaxID=1014 RepID=F0P0E1_WEEVC|nr:prolyl-tRNA synthetase [Weeksella virosa]ADX67425.1 prolyl-tRNA synthetase [Weeksella virosa DSM 16922]